MNPIMAKAIGYMKPDIDPNTRLYIPLNEGVGSVAKDYSQYNNHATLTDVEWSNEGFNGAGKFNGSTSRGVTEATNPGTTHTIEFLIQSFGSSEVQYIFDAETGRLILAWVSFDDPTKIGFFDSTWKFYGNIPSANILHRTVFLFNGSLSKTKMYLNGSQYSTELDYIPLAIGGAVNIGARYISDLGHWFSFVGAISEIIIRAHVKNPAQIAADCYEVVCN